MQRALLCFVSFSQCLLTCSGRLTFSPFAEAVFPTKHFPPSVEQKVLQGRQSFQDQAVATENNKLGGGAVLDSARLPIALMNSAEMLFRYANPAFCKLVGLSPEQMIGVSFRQLLPDQQACLLLLQRAYRDGKCETHTEREHTGAPSLFWAYEIWPIWSDVPADETPLGVVLQITEPGPLHRQATVMNEALLLSAVRQHELAEAAEVLNEKLTAEIGERRRAELEIEQLAFYDLLTGLPNRRLLMDRLHHSNVACSRTMHHGAVLFIDLDHFKSLNDTRGHHVGDLLLQQVGQRLKECVREDDTVARLGGDEFVVMLEGLSANLEEAQDQAKRVGAKVRAALGKPYLLANHVHHSTGSIGIGMFGKDRASVDDLLNHADLAQYRAKSSGGDGVRLFNAEMHSDAMARAALEADLRTAVQKNQLRLHYQVQVDAAGKTRGVEALLRWEHPERGLVAPADFMPCAEEHGILEALGLWVMEAACTQLTAWSRKPETAFLTLALNVSGQEFGHPEFVPRVLSILDRAGVDPTKLIVEFTEGAMIGPVEETLAKMTALKTRGISFALDDFGTGYSPLASLKTLPLSQVKIGRSFVSDVLTSHSDGVIAGALIAMGQSLGLTVVAEGVESEEQQRFLAKHGCRMYQGYLFGRPLPLEALVL